MDDDPHYPPRNDPEPPGTTVDAGSPDASIPIEVASACAEMAKAWCEAAIVCDLDTPTPGQETMPACKRVRTTECNTNRTGPVLSQELDRCLTAITEQGCTADMHFPGWRACCGTRSRRRPSVARGLGQQ
ncbi:MAG TPA: hypothetical protein VK698_36690 [Kofleriaceae bacterium]|nr:hypothetical protein [Kofleriaceae bacterium]